MSPGIHEQQIWGLKTDVPYKYLWKDQKRGWKGRNVKESGRSANILRWRCWHWWKVTRILAKTVFIRKCNSTKFHGLYKQLNLFTSKNQITLTPQSFWEHSWVYRGVVLPISKCIYCVKTMLKEWWVNFWFLHQSMAPNTQQTLQKARPIK